MLQAGNPWPCSKLFYQVSPTKIDSKVKVVVVFLLARDLGYKISASSIQKRRRSALRTGWPWPVTKLIRPFESIPSNSHHLPTCKPAIMASSVDAKLLKSTKFPVEFNQKVDMQKVNVEVLKK
jgi:hypothetical protein